MKIPIINYPPTPNGPVFGKNPHPSNKNYIEPERTSPHPTCYIAGIGLGGIIVGLYIKFMKGKK